MGKYSSFIRQKPKPRNQGVHPVMRGIGCIMMILVPILAFLASMPVISFAAARGMPTPPEWFGPPTIPPILWKVEGLAPVLQYLERQNDLEIKLIFTIVISLVVAVVMSMIYGLIYSAFGPPKYGPQDAPPIKGRKPKPYKR